jgi:Carboxypeptidase regulatory-like domain
MGTLAKVHVWLVCVVLAPAAAHAQASIVGTARDSSGAVLPGVTIEAASPALIEKVRIAVTDGSGQYRIENLRPGVFSVTFTLPGFNVVRREGIELTGSFVATVNGDLRVGSVEETITVTGETPVVDVQSTLRQRVLTQEVLEALPAGRVVTALAGVTVGVTANRDVGGMLGDGQGAGGLAARGVEDSRILVGGVASSTSYRLTQGAPNVGAYQEIVVDTGGVDAEQAWGGVHVNIIPREGGNTFNGVFVAAFANEALSSDNFTQELKDRGLSAPNTLKELLDVNPTFGGPIVRDKVWFNTSGRYSRAWSYAPVFLNKNAGDPNVWTYEPDLSQQATNEHTLRSFTHRLTWQATAKHKVAFQYESTHQCDCPRQVTASLSPEANIGNYTVGSPYRHVSVQWTAPISGRLLLEANILNLKRVVTRANPNPYFVTGAVPLVPVQEQSTGLRYRGTATARISANDLLYGRAVASYVTGAHAFKAGFVYGRIPVDDYTFTLDAPIEYRFRNGVPNRITLHATPFRRKTDLDADHGLFVQDRWTRGRMTLSGGLRYSFARIKYPETVMEPSVWIPNRNFVTPEANGATWHDLSPRTSLAVDVFGNGKTALKVSYNHYLVAQDRSTIFGELASPVGSLVTSTTRSWTDGNRNYVPECDLINPLANGECGAMANREFGSNVPGRAYDPNATSGWGRRYDNWQFSAGVQQEIMPRVSVDVAYWRTAFGNIAGIVNRAVGPSDYTEYSVMAPADSRLPGRGGYVLAGLYDINPAKFGQSDEFVTLSDGQTDVFNGFDFVINARPRPGVLLQGGTSTERRSTNDCDLVARFPGSVIELGPFVNRSEGAARTSSIPRQFCDAPGTFQTQVKLLGSFVIPVIDVQMSANLQNLPGPEIGAEYIVPNATVASSLGRSLAGAASSVTVSLIEPRTMFGERMNQLDLRFAKILRFGGRRATVGVDLYNALNSHDVLAVDEGFDNWLRPEAILTARFAKLVVQLDF